MFGPCVCCLLGCLQVDLAIQYGEDADVKVRDEPDLDQDMGDTGED